MKKYYDIFIHLLLCIKNKNMEQQEINDFLFENIDFDYIHESEDSLLTDTFYTIYHFSLGEEDISEREIVYLFNCLTGARIYSVRDRENNNIDC